MFRHIIDHRMSTSPTLKLFTALFLALTNCVPWISAQPGRGAPVVTAVAKGPNQINLAWSPVTGAYYGYLVEIRSSNDSRYLNWTELRPVPDVSGYSCDSSIELNGGTCRIHDPNGAHVFTPRSNGVPYWVTEGTYIDPQDNTSAQFIAWGLKPHAQYSFRVRTYSETADSGISGGPYSAVVGAATLDYELRYVSPQGKDTNTGQGPDPSQSWRSLAYGTQNIGCGQALIVAGGNYESDAITMAQTCSSDKKAVVMVNPGSVATITSIPSSGAWHAILLTGRHIVIDSLRVESPSPKSDYDVEIDGDYNALLNIETHPPVVPATKAGVTVFGGHNLVYRSAIHDYGSPDQVQNPNGNGGYVLSVLGGKAVENVVWSNHLTRGGHDVALCKGGCGHSRFVNNIMDGGWGMGFEAIDNSPNNLIEGNIMKDVGRLVSAYKPSIELSAAGNTVRRNISIGGARWGLEVSALVSSAADNLVYNNTFYAPGGCIFQSVSGGNAKYDNNVYANNICYKIANLATDIYNPNRTNRIEANVIAAVRPVGILWRNKPMIIWNHSGGSTFESPKPLAFADRNYSPPFSSNSAFELDPRFVNEAGGDFHLQNDSPLIGKGVAISDAVWGSPVAPVDLGAFGISAIQAPAGVGHK